MELEFRPLNASTAQDFVSFFDHLDYSYKPDWQVTPKLTIAMIERARRQGMDVTCDQYPYCATATTLSVNIPTWAFEGGFEAVPGLGFPHLEPFAADDDEAAEEEGDQHAENPRCQQHQKDRCHALPPEMAGAGFRGTQTPGAAYRRAIVADRRIAHAPPRIEKNQIAAVNTTVRATTV